MSLAQGVVYVAHSQALMLDDDLFACNKTVIKCVFVWWFISELKSVELEVRHEATIWSTHW